MADILHVGTFEQNLQCALSLSLSLHLLLATLLASSQLVCNKLWKQTTVSVVVGIFYPHDALLVRSLPSKDLFVCLAVCHTPVLSHSGFVSKGLNYIKTFLTI